MCFHFFSQNDNTNSVVMLLLCNGGSLKITKAIWPLRVMELYADVQPTICVKETFINNYTINRCSNISRDIIHNS